MTTTPLRVTLGSTPSLASPARFTCGLALWLCTQACGGGDSGAGPVTYALGLTIGPGVTATPQGTQSLADGTGFTRSTSSFTAGTVVPYSFVAQETGSAVHVTRDGNPVAGTGTVTMDQPHNFVVSINTLVGSPMPAFTGRSAAGQAIRLSDYRGKILLVEFGEMTCAGSLAGAPILEGHYQINHPRGLEMVTVQVYGPTTLVASTSADLQAWQARYGLSFPVLSDPAASTKIFNWNITSKVTDFPTLYIVDTNGIIRYRFAGWDRPLIAAALNRLFP